MSAILSADDLNDFISPGVACIKPVETLPPVKKKEGGDDEVVLDGPLHQHHPPPPAHISLTDCLACSGCVTSAEAVLVSLQSHAEVLATLDAAPALRLDGKVDADAVPSVVGLENPESRVLVASVSPQSCASLAAAAGVGQDEARRMLDALLRGPDGLAASGKWHNSFAWLLDTDVVAEAGLVLAAEEALASTPADKASPTRPVLAASCPGWVCYAEKTHPHVLPHLSRVKSPQALMGTLLKTVLSRRLRIPPSRIWHMAVMPCFDKKLEASRGELTDVGWAGDGSSSGDAVRDVDCVITSKEVLMLCESRGIDFFSLPRDSSSSSSSSIPPPPPFPDSIIHDFLFPAAGGSRRPPRAAGSSGGLLHHILRVRAAQSPRAEIHMTRGRNADVVEYSVNLDGEPLFRAARYYGFRNIQNLVRKLKPARPSRMPGGKPFGGVRRPVGKPAPLEYGYVEVMACPGGCTNGGGQIKVDDPVVAERKGLVRKAGPQEHKEWLAEVDEAYFSRSEAEMDNGGRDRHGDVPDGISASHIHNILSHWSVLTGITLERLAFTSYREVESDVGRDQTTNADKVVQLAGKIGGGW
ncbi:hypothetical protein L249_6820 [Ophiocordyceps polyrhachis-furcata BCC 54312]|uniref:Cytosolic Fe-S cluster assembly factor NAR1 n=1 Tax=Ophiocordyceps polyrhachis-furcata BCC 54312 TaxID=1330021 RepID=A0A367LL10_9HYPO|nr:hypothetical protein L249_6820 [Ophiocordyceps polyrhachis-furcata BCC 54312]